MVVQQHDIGVLREAGLIPPLSALLLTSSTSLTCLYLVAHFKTIYTSTSNNISKLIVTLIAG